MLQSLFDDAVPKGMQNYWKADFITELSDGKREWSTVAVGRNVIDAGLDSLVEGLEYCLLRHERAAETEGAGEESR